MRIRSLTLHGFKSFGHRTVLEFSPRITVIAGPNGSGKSNVLDGLRWATGGGRASEFRAGERTDLIFHGAAGKRGVGHAEVETELETPDGLVTVRRTLTRDGTSRLQLNGRAARLLDVGEALSGSGLGKGNLAVIGQGEISDVLMADPGRLLLLVAEAAGTARLSGRREQADARLQRAREHSGRLRDIHGGLLARLETLGHEAETAALHARLSRELLLLRFTIATARREALGKGTAEAARSEQELSVLVRGMKDGLKNARARLAQERQSVEELQENYRLDSARHEAWQGECRLAGSRVESSRERLGATDQRLLALSRERQQLEQATPPPEPAGDEAALETQITAAAGELRTTETALAAATEEVAASRALLAQLQDRQREAAGQTGRREERRDALERQLRSTRLRLAELEEEQPAGTGTDSPESDRLRNELDKMQERQEALLRTIASAQQEHADAAASLRSTTESVRRLEASAAARSGYANGPRLALGSGLPGIIGSVADLLDVEPAFREAIAAALGGRAENIVVGTAAEGKALIDWIRTQNAFVTVLPLDLVRPRRSFPLDRFLGRTGVIGPAVDQPSFSERFRPLFRQLLGNTLLLEDLDAAVALAREETDRPRLVTLKGDVLETGGAMSGGRRHGAGAALLGQARELRALRRKEEESTRTAADRKQELKQLQDEARAVRRTLSELEDQLETARSEEAARSEREAVRRHLVGELSGREESLRAELAALDSAPAPQPPAAEELSTAEAAETRAGATKLQLEEDRSQLGLSLQQLRADLKLLRQQRSSWQEASDRFEADRRRLAELLSEQEQLTAGRQQLERDLEQAEAQLNELKKNVPADPETSRLRLEGARQELYRAEQRQEQLQEDLANHEEQLGRVRLTAARRETLLEAATAELDRFPPGLELLDGAERTLRGRLAEVERELEGLGPVNHRAAAELEQESHRSRQLAADLLEADEAASELETALERLDTEIRERSARAIASVAESFSRHVGELFGAGATAAIDTEWTDGRPTGLSITLQPPGKRTSRLNLLSVGERTMGALAFLFALMDGSSSGGLPLAVLDEVDAPLDEANIGRFTRFVERLADRGTQFLLVSHQKTTFGIADTMWGVTAEAGVSRVFSISRAAVPAELTLEQGPK